LILSEARFRQHIEEITMANTISKVCLSAAIIVGGVHGEAQDSLVLEYELEDQFQKIHTSSDVLDTVVLLIGSDKKGVKFNGLWGQAIHAELSDHPHYGRVTNLAYANLKGVPFFLKGMIRSKFPQDKEAWVLMDWKGALFKAYDFVPKVSNVFVFGPDGVLVHHASGSEPTAEAVSQVVEAIRQLLDQNS
jgi:hypothetical protein